MASFTMADLPGISSLLSTAGDPVNLAYDILSYHTVDTALGQLLWLWINRTTVTDGRPRGLARIGDAIQELQVLFPQIDLSVRESTERGELSLVVTTSPGPG